MASVTSLGIHKPSALPYLVAEGILPTEPPESLYKWQTVPSEPAADENERQHEELLNTDDVVVWSRGGVVQRVFRFDIEEEAVTQAVFTHFLVTPERKPGHSSKNLQPSGPDHLDGRQGLVLNVQENDATNVRRQDDVGDVGKLLDDSKNYKICSRALVIILKTQAHIFFLSGTSHTVHLPFEVEGAFPLPHGLLLQRRTSLITPRALHLPAVPPNSFVHSQLESSGLLPGSQGQSSLANLETSSDPRDPFIPLLNNVRRYANDSDRDAALPRLYYLNDPLAEVGAVATESKIAFTRSPSHGGSTRRHSGAIDPHETIFYVSPQDEIGFNYVGLKGRQPLILAVSHNHETHDTTIWSIEYIAHKTMTNTNHRISLSSSGIISKRRSSYGPGATTGINTPVTKPVVTSRDSFGAGKARTALSKDALPHDSLNDGEKDLVSHLDFALENPNAAIRTSRRVSSLLARADLSSGFDKASFSDLAASVYSTSSVGRLGYSLGSHSVKTNAGLNNGTTLPRSRTSFEQRSSIDPPALEPPLENMLEDSESNDDSTELLRPRIYHKLSCLQKEMTMSKAYVISHRNSHLGQASTETMSTKGLKVLVLKSPDHTTTAQIDESRCFVFLVDRDHRNLTTMEFEIRDYTAAAGKVSRGKKAQSLKSTSYREIKMVNIKHEPNLIDASIVRNGECSRLLLLGQDAEARLSLQAPWAPTVRLQLPSSLNVFNPYHIATGVSPRQRREGGFKRVLSQGPATLAKLEHCGQTQLADVEDVQCVKHSIEIQLQPHSALVRRMILLCDSILPNVTGTRDHILTLWWSAMSWLRSRSEDEIDIERVALNVALFSMVVGFIGDRRTETTPRQKRKGGLLRSSSGANTNLESWEAMLTEERSQSGVSPLWMDGEAWQWTARSENSSVQSHDVSSRTSRVSRPTSAALPLQKKSSYLIHCLTLAREFTQFLHVSSSAQEHWPLIITSVGRTRLTLATILIGLHLLREEMKLEGLASDALHGIAPILAQLGGWLGWPSWSFKHDACYMLESTRMTSWLFDDSVIHGDGTPAEPFTPPSILQFIEATILGAGTNHFITLLDLIVGKEASEALSTANTTLPSLLMNLTPRTIMITNLLTSRSKRTMPERVSEISSWGLKISMLETLPESVAVPFRAAISFCQAQPAPGMGKDILEMIGRDDLKLLDEEGRITRSPGRLGSMSPSDVLRDIHTICSSTLEVETIGSYDGAAEVDRQTITRMVFKEDQRFAEVAKLLHPLHAPVAQCVPRPDWSDTELLEAQQELAKTVALRTLAVSPGRGCLYYNARLPLLTERFPIHGFTLSCVMKPSNTTVTADKSAYTEEKVSWAFFHAGVEAGLSIATNAKGVDTSWISFNKPQELKNRHAGFLLALGLNGHLKSIAKWVAFKYLTPKHTMTSIGLLLGLAASYLGSMDTLITRLLSVHVTRMLPPGSAELNLSPLMQTSGIMGIGLLYCNTQHRRMSEVMLSEMENVDAEEPSSPQDSLRDEGYRLAAGFALGFINLGRGRDLKGLHDMRIVERLLALGVGTKKVSLVHILDKGTAAAVVALALIFMKTRDAVLARKIDVPDTIHQFDYVRPDVFLLRTVARHLIMWHDIRATSSWIKNRLPSVYQHRFKLTSVRALNSEDMPFFNIVAGLCLSIGLRFAGSGSVEVRNLLCHYLDQFMRICRLPVLNYDSKLARTTVRNCQDVVALAAASGMAGFGDLQLFRRLRSLHGRTEIDIPYGSHIAAHLAIGILFLGGGTHTFNTSDLAIASLLCAFYPLLPTTVLDNKSHLQAFRHFWVLAAEPRCLVIYEADTHQLVPLAIVVTLKGGAEQTMTAPCLLPELANIVNIRTMDPEYWQVSLDIAANPAHYAAFKRHQSIFVRRRAAYDAHASLFSATMQALNDGQSAHRLGRQVFQWVFTLPTFASFDKAERALVLPLESSTAVYRATRGTVVDDRLVLEMACMNSGKSERLWNLRILFAWADEVGRSGEPWGWLGKEVIAALRAKLVLRKKALRP